MACGCSKRKASVSANAARSARVNSVVYQPSPVAETHAKLGNQYRRIQYLVAPKEQLIAEEYENAETYMTLAEAQKRIRDLGPGFGVKALR